MMNRQFSHAEGVTLTAVENSAPTPMHIADVNKLMLVVVNRFLILTAEQLSNYLIDTLHLEGMKEENLKQQVKIMTRSNYLTAYEFRDPDARLMYTVYGLGYRGRGLLKAMGEAPRMTGYIANLDAFHALKLLSANQHLIKGGVPLMSLQVAKTILVQGKNIDKTHLIARPQGIAHTAERTLLLESVRRGEDYLSQLLEKLGRMQLLMDRDDLNVPLTAPAVTLICEDEIMLAEVRNCLAGKKYCFDVFCTTDAAAYGEERLVVRASEKRFLDRLRGMLFHAA